MVSGWQCVKLGSAAVAGIVPVAPWMIAAYLAAHKLPVDCAADCRFVIPAEEFRRGGMFGPGAAPPEMPMAMPEGYAFAGDWAPDGLPASYIVPEAAMPPQGGASAAEGGGSVAWPGGHGGVARPAGLPAAPGGGGGAPLPRGQGRTGQPPGTGEGEPPADLPLGNALPVAVPAPAAWSLLLAALLGLAAVRRRISPCSHRGG